MATTARLGGPRAGGARRLDGGPRKKLSRAHRNGAAQVLAGGKTITLVDDRRTNEPLAEKFVGLLKHEAAASYGEESPEYSAFGFKPRKKAAELTPDQKQQKLERLRATRASRHTEGKRQRRAAKDDAGSPPAPPAGSKP